MRCVSYTRTTCSQPVPVSRQTESITQQNEEISQFVRQRGWKISKKYSDRKKDPKEETAFLEMKKDGIAGEFDCLVVASLYYCGKGTAPAIDLLSFVFLLAGIHFAVVDDDICSAEITEQEAAEYLERKKQQFRSEKLSIVCRATCEKRKYPKYGYYYKEDSSEDSMELVIDPEAADTIREIFQLADEGHTDSEIAHILNKEETEPAHVYMRRIQGKPLPESENREWGKNEVDAILSNQLYIGRWERTVKGEKIITDCPAIVSEEVFRNVRKLHEAHWQREVTRGKGVTPLTGKMSDYDTGASLFMLTRRSANEKAFYLRCPQTLGVHYKKKWILYSDVEYQVMEQVIREKQRAQEAVQMIGSEEGMKWKERQLQALSEKAQEIFKKMMELEGRRHMLRQGYIRGVNSNEYKTELPGIDAMFSDIDDRMTEIQKEMAEVNKTFSKENPWIRTFCDLDTVQGLTMDLSKKCIGRVECVRFEYVAVQFKYSEWFEKLPGEWFGGIS